jgi:hypothetical protein
MRLFWFFLLSATEVGLFDLYQTSHMHKITYKLALDICWVWCSMHIWLKYTR